MGTSDSSMPRGSQPASTYMGTGYILACPCCGDELWVFESAKGEVTVTRMADMPSEEDISDACFEGDCHECHDEACKCMCHSKKQE